MLFLSFGRPWSPRCPNWGRGRRTLKKEPAGSLVVSPSSFRDASTTSLSPSRTTLSVRFANCANQRFLWAPVAVCDRGVSWCDRGRSGPRGACLPHPGSDKQPCGRSHPATPPPLYPALQLECLPVPTAGRHSVRGGGAPILILYIKNFSI